MSIFSSFFNTNEIADIVNQQIDVLIEVLGKTPREAGTILHLPVLAERSPEIMKNQIFTYRHTKYELECTIYFGPKEWSSGHPDYYKDIGKVVWFQIDGFGSLRGISFLGVPTLSNSEGCDLVADEKENRSEDSKYEPPTRKGLAVQRLIYKKRPVMLLDNDDSD